MAATPSKFHRYKRIGQELHRRSFDPFVHPSFVIYFLVGIIGLGGLGFWLELYTYVNTEESKRTLAALRVALVTLFPTLAGSTAIQTILAENDRRDLRSCAVLVLATFTTVALIIAQDTVIEAWSIAIGVAMWLLSMWIWWVANANQPDYQDRIEPRAAVGGDDTERDLSGNLNDFKV